MDLIFFVLVLRRQISVVDCIRKTLVSSLGSQDFGRTETNFETVNDQWFILLLMNELTRYGDEGPDILLLLL